MKMYEAVTVVPPRAQFRRQSKFLSVFKALMTIGEKYFLPVECRSNNEAAHLKQECTRRGLVAERRAKTVFIQGCAMKAVVFGTPQELQDAEEHSHVGN